MTDYNKGYRPVSLTETFMGITSSYNNANNNNNASPSSVMQETLLSQPTAVPVATSRPMMEVVAPADLPEGYEFEVQLDSSSSKFKVQVPAGGIEQGQTFSVPYPGHSASSTTNAAHHQPAVSIPVGHWRDDLFDCFRYGICHPHCWTSLLCTFLATGQVIRRMKFDWTGHPTDHSNQQALAFPLIFGIVVLYFVIHFALYVAVIAMDPNAGHYDDEGWTEEDPQGTFLVVLLLYQTFGFVYWILSTIVLIRTRRSVRERYGIPALHGLEDCMCSVCCHCCVAGQLLRHTTDYDVHPSVIFTDTGLPKHVAAIV